MNQNNLVVFKGTKDGILLMLNPEADFEEIKAQLLEKVQKASKFFEGASTAIIIKGRKLTQEQEKIIMDIVIKQTNLSISFLKTEDPDSGNINYKKGLKFGLPDEHKTKFRKGNIRSGQCISFDGSVVIMGDINHGGVVKARGNIVVLGDLKGMAHAGYGGNNKAFIMAINMIPAQLRISDIIMRFPEEAILKQNKQPEYAYIYNGEIYVTPLKQNHKNLTLF